VSRTVRILGVAALGVALLAPAALACWDNTDDVIVKLKKLELSTEQLKEVFAFQKEHQEVVVRAHREGLGCRYHENHEAVFEKNAIGVLNDAQFEQHTGRARTEVESLQYQNRQLMKEIARLKAELKKLEAELAKAKQ
jgi:uncharacterized protein involved in exopolysaccharide biosynthesis